MGKRIIIIIGGVLGLVLISLKALEVTYFSARLPLEMYLGGVAILFTTGGIAAGAVWMKRRQAVKELVPLPSIEIPLTETQPVAQVATDLSDRELDVLRLIAKGCSNQEVADKLFISLNTVKTHSSNIYQKLNVKRRTQAVVRATELGIL